PDLFDARGTLSDLITTNAYPLALRREALRTFAEGKGARRLIAMAREGKLPPELKTEATTAIYTNRDRRIHEEAAEVLPPPKLAAGRTLPPLGMIIHQEGNADKGREVFFRSGTNSCASCHRVQGRGQWVGPDLSTIGTKYGKDELLRSILNPSAAIGYNFQAYIVALNDGRVLTGLPLEQSNDRLVLKLADGQRMSLKSTDIEDKKVSEVSLMPEGLAETLSDGDLVDLLAFLSTLKQPVSIVGQYHVAGPIEEHDAARVASSGGRIDVSAPLTAAGGPAGSWRRLAANAESLLDLASLGSGGPERTLLLYTPVISGVEQQARFVLDTKADARVWLNGKKLDLPAPSEGKPPTTSVHLPKGKSDLLILLPTGPNASLVTSLVAPQPLEFSATQEGKVSGR
ncbi:MAG TPA: c-type cytochrome, partial [Isosphaeraceae bacterium]|nr:c-type cytochrome [Isosphaeraceae bacterium]